MQTCARRSIIWRKEGRRLALHAPPGNYFWIEFLMNTSQKSFLSACDRPCNPGLLVTVFGTNKLRTTLVFGDPAHQVTEPGVPSSTNRPREHKPLAKALGENDTKSHSERNINGWNGN